MGVMHACLPWRLCQEQSHEMWLLRGLQGCVTLVEKAMGSRCSTRFLSRRTSSDFSGMLEQSTQLQFWQYTPADQVMAAKAAG